MQSKSRSIKSSACQADMIGRYTTRELWSLAGYYIVLGWRGSDLWPADHRSIHLLAPGHLPVRYRAHHLAGSIHGPVRLSPWYGGVTTNWTMTDETACRLIDHGGLRESIDQSSRTKMYHDPRSGSRHVNRSVRSSLGNVAHG